jgi:nucleoid DNA-binding protein
MRSIGSKEFFKLVAVNSGVSDLEITKRIYYGLIKTLSKELRSNHVVKMPDWGDFTLRIYKSRMTVNVNSGRLEPLPPKPYLKFTSDWKVKKYFQSLMSSEEKGL